MYRRTDNTLAEGKGTKRQTMIYKTLRRKLKIEQQEPHTKPGGELRCSGMETSSCSTCGTQALIQGGGGPKIGKKMIFWGKMAIFHTKYPKNFRACPPSSHFF
jgi:hypothetical protein